MPNNPQTISDFTIFETSIGKIGIKVFLKHKNLWLTQKAMAELFRKVSRELEYYNLDAIMAVGYRVNSQQAIEFRTWAHKKLKE